MDLPEPAAGMRWVADLTQDDEDIVWIQLPIAPTQEIDVDVKL